MMPLDVSLPPSPPTFVAWEYCVLKTPGGVKSRDEIRRKWTEWECHPKQSSESPNTCEQAELTIAVAINDVGFQAMAINYVGFQAKAITDVGFRAMAITDVGF